MISVLCANKKSIYKTIPGIDVWDNERDAYFFTGSNPVITHAPCAQWSRLKAFSNNNHDEKELAYHCLKKVIRNGGIFEHPAGSDFFKIVGITKLYSVDQVWWGFPARKKTYLFFQGCKPMAFPIMGHIATKVVSISRATVSLPEMSKTKRSDTVEPFARWMIDSINHYL